MSIYRENDLVVVVADGHAKVLLDAIIERGQERRCLARFSYEIDLQPKHDAFFRFTEQFLPHDLPPSLHLLLCWDHKDCGRATRPLRENEREALDCLAQHGVPEDRALCLAFDPELEVVYTPLFAQVKALLAGSAGGPTEAAILRQAQRSRKRPQVPADLSFDDALARYPKEMLTALAVLLNQRPSLGEVHGKLASQLSIPRLKAAGGGPMERITAALSRWFPGENAPCSAVG